LGGVFIFFYGYCVECVIYAFVSLGKLPYTKSSKSSKLFKSGASCCSVVNKAGTCEAGTGEKILDVGMIVLNYYYYLCLYLIDIILFVFFLNYFVYFFFILYI